MVRDCEDANLFADNRVDDAERKAPRNETTSAPAPDRAEVRMVQEKARSVLELSEERLRKCGPACCR